MNKTLLLLLTSAAAFAGTIDTCNVRNDAQTVYTGSCAISNLQYGFSTSTAGEGGGGAYVSTYAEGNSGAYAIAQADMPMTGNNEYWATWSYGADYALSFGIGGVGQDLNQWIILNRTGAYFSGTGDVSIYSQNYDEGGSSLTVQYVGPAVPEPGTLLLACGCLVGLAAYRRLTRSAEVRA